MISMILSNSLKSLKLIWADSQWFDSQWKNLKFIWGNSLKFIWFYLGAILNDSWWLAKYSEIYLGWLLVILNYSIGDLLKNWNLFGVILDDFDDFQWLMKFIYLFWADSQQFFMILGDLQKLWNLFETDSWWLLNDLQKTLKFICTESQWFSMILGDWQKNSEIYLGWFSVILWFLMIVSDSQKTEIYFEVFICDS